MEIEIKQKVIDLLSIKNNLISYFILSIIVIGFVD